MLVFASKCYNFALESFRKDNWTQLDKVMFHYIKVKRMYEKD